jgi:hypothetical protein
MTLLALAAWNDKKTHGMTVKTRGMPTHHICLLIPFVIASAVGNLTPNEIPRTRGMTIKTRGMTASLVSAFDL